MADTFETQQRPTRAFVVHPDLGDRRDQRRAPDLALEEAVALARALPAIEVVGATVAKLRNPSPGMLFSSGKLEEVGAEIAAVIADEAFLDLDAPVDQYLPEFADLQVLEGFDGDEPRLRAPATRATVRHLVTHTSGLAYWFFNADIVRWEEATGTPNVLSGTLTCRGPRGRRISLPGNHPARTSSPRGPGPIA